MKKLLLCIMVAFFAISTQAQTIVGTWKTVDSRTGTAKSYLRIYKAKNGLYYGKVLKLLNRPAGENPNPNCINCPTTDYRHNKPVIGMVIMTRLKASKDLKSATGGKILDPEVGKSFDCQIRLSSDGNTLKMRGYLGMPTIGRTQVWTRVK